MNKRMRVAVGALGGLTLLALLLVFVIPHLTTYASSTVQQRSQAASGGQQKKLPMPDVPCTSGADQINITLQSGTVKCYADAGALDLQALSQTNDPIAQVCAGNDIGEMTLSDNTVITIDSGECVAPDVADQQQPSVAGSSALLGFLLKKFAVVSVKMLPRLVKK